MKQSACGLALTLLSEHDVCPSCGWSASDHRGWQAELARGAIPNPPRPLEEPARALLLADLAELGLLEERSPAWEPLSIRESRRKIAEYESRAPDEEGEELAPSSPAVPGEPLEPADDVADGRGLEPLDGLLGAAAEPSQVGGTVPRILRIAARALLECAAVLEE